MKKRDLCATLIEPPLFLLGRGNSCHPFQIHYNAHKDIKHDIHLSRSRNRPNTCMQSSPNLECCIACGQVVCAIFQGSILQLLIKLCVI
jgi:hypothetical protein